MSQNIDNNVWSAYDQSFREDAHQLLAWGYEDSRHLITSNSEETEITGFIVQAIRERLNSPSTDERFIRYSIMEDNPIEGEGRTGKRRMRIDIIIEATYPKPRPIYVFEAKRLCKPAHGISKYLGDDGMMRFINDRYASGCSEVVMLAFVQTDSPAYWINEIKNQLNNSNAQFRITNNFVEMQILPVLNYEWSSGHRRQSGNNIIIFHLLLDCLTTKI